MWALLRGFADGLAITVTPVACAPVIVFVAPAAGVFALLWCLMDPLKADGVAGSASASGAATT